MQICTKCQASQLDSAKYCSECGSQIEQVSVASQESTISEDIENAPRTDYLATDKAINLKPTQIIFGAAAILILVIGFFVYRSQGPSISTDSQATTDSPVTTTDNSSSTPSGVDYATAIPTDEIVSTISSKLGVSINQDDPTRGITFPDISPQADIWSAPYVTLVIYTDSDSLNADKANFQQDYNNLNSNRQWESCINVVAIFPSRMQNKIDKAVNVWCPSSTPSQLPSPANPQKLAKNILTSQDQSILSAPAGEFINTSGLTLLEAGLGNITLGVASGDLKSFVDALYVAEIRGIGSTGPITASDYQYSLQPGHGLYTMVHNVFVGYGLIAVPDELVSLAAADEAAGKNYEDYR